MNDVYKKGDIVLADPFYKDLNKTKDQLSPVLNVIVGLTDLGMVYLGIPICKGNHEVVLGITDFGVVYPTPHVAKCENVTLFGYDDKTHRYYGKILRKITHEGDLGNAVRIAVTMDKLVTKWD